MANTSLVSMRNARTHAATALSEHILNMFKAHLTSCQEKGCMQPFILKIQTNVDDDTAAEALKICAKWTDQNGNNLIGDYVWFDSEQPDIFQQLQALAALGVVGGLIVAVTGPLVLAMVLLETALIFDDTPRKPTTRTVSFVPSAFRAGLRTPLRYYNVVGGHVNTVTQTAANIAAQASGLAAQASNLAGQGLTFTRNLWGKNP